MTNSYVRNINEGRISGAVFIDLPKAFDTVNHKILIRKLHSFGIDGKAAVWLTNYLMDRKQQVSIGDTMSDILPIHTGIPQGSILGPLLFVLFINDLPDCLENSVAHMFADDTTIVSSDHNIEGLTSKLNADMLLLQNWLNKNKLILNVKKSVSMLITTHQKRRFINETDFKIYINNEELTDRKSVV